MDSTTKRRPFFRRNYTRGDSPLPDRKYRAVPLTKDRTDWHCMFDVVGNRVIGSMYHGPEIVRRTFNVKHLNGKFRVDIGTGSSVTIEFPVPRSTTNGGT